MKIYVMFALIAAVAMVMLTGCGSSLGLPDYNDKGGNFANYSTKKNIVNYMDPAQNVYK